MYWLITYSQRGSAGNVIVANTIIEHITPAYWLHAMVEKYPDGGTLLLFAIKISEADFNDLDGNI